MLKEMSTWYVLFKSLDKFLSLGRLWIISHHSQLCPVPDSRIFQMHAKLQLLSHPTHLRVVVPSANLVPYDWGESGVMENVCSLITQCVGLECAEALTCGKDLFLD
jgi:hypothetical protein